MGSFTDRITEETENRLARGNEYIAALPAGTIGKAFRFISPLDNHSPARASAYGYGVMSARLDDGAHTITLWREDFARPGTRSVADLHRCVFIVDFGTSVAPYYVTGWSSTAGTLFLQHFPFNPDGATRPDNGQPVDYSTWAVGPRTAYHLKASEVRQASTEDDAPQALKVGEIYSEEQIARLLGL